jgi:hypothetical protein
MLPKVSQAISLLVELVASLSFLCELRPTLEGTESSRGYRIGYRINHDFLVAQFELCHEAMLSVLVDLS